jgi:hypothetical protein
MTHSAQLAILPDRLWMFGGCSLIQRMSRGLMAADFRPGRDR